MNKQLLVIALIFFSCKEKSQEVSDSLNNNLFTYFKENLKSVDSTYKLDSVRVIKFDTMAKSDLLFVKLLTVYDDIDQKNSVIKSNIERNKTNIQLIKLYKGLDQILFENSIEDAKKLVAETNEIQDQVKGLSKYADSLTNEQNLADTAKLIYYQVRCLVQYQRKDMSVKRDTGFAFLTPEKVIVKFDDMIY